MRPFLIAHVIHTASSRRSVLCLAWLGLVAYWLLAASCAHAATVAVAKPGGIAIYDTVGRSLQEVAAGQWVDIAYAGDGRLFGTRSNGSGCDLVSVDTGQTVLSTSDITGPIDRSDGLCDISSDPTDGLLFTASAGTLGSATTYHLDVTDLTVSEVLYGYNASASATGRVATVQHRYFARGGSYEQPWLRTATGAERALAAVPSMRVGLQFKAVALSRDGRRVAGTCSVGSHPRDVLMVGSATGRLTRAVWPLGGRRVFSGVEWLDDASGLIAGVASSYSARTFALYRTDTKGSHRVRLLSGVIAFAVK